MAEVVSTGVSHMCDNSTVRHCGHSNSSQPAKIYSQTMIIHIQMKSNKLIF